MKVKVRIARFPGKYIEHPASVDWAWRTYQKAKADPRVSDVEMWNHSDTPITMVRNLAVVDALAAGVDVLLMVDNDMRPDCEPGGKPFWDTAFDYWWERRHAPMVIGAPYTGPPPINNIYVFAWDNRNNHDTTNCALPQYPRHQAAQMAGIQRCGALPTGVIAYFNLGQCMKLKASDPGPGLPPRKDKGWYWYEWPDDTCSQKASTEDVTNTRDIGVLLANSGIPEAGVYCNWDAWAAHIKPQEFGKPRPVMLDQVWDVFKAAQESGQTSDERMIDLDRSFPTVAPTGEVAA